jgi:hypothetical protein
MLRRAGAAGAVVWALALPAATWLASRPQPGWIGSYVFSFATYAVGSLICHQRPERSFALFGLQMPVCARCAGLYAGAAICALIALSSGRTRGVAGGESMAAARTSLVWEVSTRRAMLAVCALPTAVTLVYEWSTGSTPSNIARAITAFPLGACIAWLLWRGAAGGREIN